MLNAFRVILLVASTVLIYYGFFGAYSNLNVRAPVNAVPQFCSKAGHISVSFDEGPSEFTSDLLATLRVAGVKGTFHFTTAYMQGNIAALTNVETAAKDGHVVGLKFPSDPSNLSDEELEQALLMQSERIFGAIKKYPKYLRFPYGTYGEREIKIAKCLGMVVTEWNIDTHDYEIQENKKDIDVAEKLIARYATAFAPLAPGAGRFISVHHDGLSFYENQTYLLQVFRYIQSYKYQPVTLDKCLGDSSAYRTKNEGCSDDGKVTGTDNNNGQTVNDASYSMPYSIMGFLSAIMSALMSI